MKFVALIVVLAFGPAVADSGKSATPEQTLSIKGGSLN